VRFPFFLPYFISNTGISRLEAAEGGGKVDWMK
jgi:hypothetical protein